MTLARSGDSFVVRTWKQADLAYVARSIQREGWDHTPRDVERCWNLEPKGCFIAESNGKPAGHIFSVLFGAIGWIGLLIVNPEKRGIGVGTALMEAAILYLEGNGAKTIKLEAVEEAAPLYRRLGFVDAFDSLRFRGIPRRSKKRPLGIGRASQIRENGLHEIAEFDAQYFGANRLSILKSLQGDFPQNCFVARENQGVNGYIMARKTQDELWIGPWICADKRVAELLFGTFLESVRKVAPYLRLGFPALNIDARELVEKLGLRLVGKSIHMTRGDRKNQGDVTCVYGIGGPEKG